jgi:hypothetical protein
MNMLNLFVAAGLTAIVPWDQILDPIVFLYFGPETIFPVASFVAGIIGVILVFWRVIVKSVRKFFKNLFGKKETYPDPNSVLSTDAPSNLEADASSE